MAFNRWGCGILVFALMPLGCLAIEPQPVWNDSTLKAIKAESNGLMAKYPVKDPQQGWVSVKDAELPPTIASLKPVMVTVYPSYVNIMTKADFDGGLGLWRNPQRQEGRFGDAA